MQFTTKSGSVYEVDQVNKRIRRLIGVKETTDRQGPEGEWRSYKDLHPSPIQLGSLVMIQWEDTVPLLEGSPEGMSPGTITSKVVSIWEPDSSAN